jgi:hypothetical protein
VLALTIGEDFQHLDPMSRLLSFDINVGHRELLAIGVEFRGPACTTSLVEYGLGIGSEISCLTLVSYIHVLDFASAAVEPVARSTVLHLLIGEPPDPFRHAPALNEVGKVGNLFFFAFGSRQVGRDFLSTLPKAEKTR